MRKLLGLLCAVAVTSNAMLSVIAAGAGHNREQIQSENDRISPLQTNFEELQRTKRSIRGLPKDARKVDILFNRRPFDVYGSSSGAYKVNHGSNDSEKILGIQGNIICGHFADTFRRQKYYIYFTVKNDNCEYEYYALKEGETTACKINGLPGDATAICIHNLAGIIFFGSSDGAYGLMQGAIEAFRVPGEYGNIVKIQLNHGAITEYGVDFIRIDGVIDKCRYDLKLKKLKDESNQCKKEVSIYKEKINTSQLLLIDQQNKFQIEKNEAILQELEKVITKYNSLDPERFLPSIKISIEKISSSRNNGSSNSSN